MHIYIDPTEAREDTRIPKAFLDQCVALPGLEETTGADWMITPLAWPEGVKCSKKKPSKIRLDKHIDAGAIFVQRKSGGDFLQSIPDLKGFQLRMLEWLEGFPGRCWLLITDVRVGVKDGRPVAHAGDDLVHIKSVSSVEGAISKWQLRGGNVKILASDEAMQHWATHIASMVESCVGERTREFTLWEPVQRLKREPENWVTTGSAFPDGIARKKLEALARELGSDDPINSPPPLYWVVMCLTSGRIVNAKGWGKTLHKRMLKWWGLPEDGSRYIRDQPRFEWLKLNFKEPLPFDVEGDGITRTGPSEYTFYNYETMSAIALMLEAVKRQEGSQ